MAVNLPSRVELGVELLPKLIPKIKKRQASVIEGLQSREIGGGFIAVMPKDGSIPAEGDDGLDGRRRRFLRKDEVPVPESLQEPSSKRALSCSNSGDGLCPGRQDCCPIGPGYTCYRDSVGTRLCSPPSSNNDTTTIAGVQEATDFAFSTTTPTPAAASTNTTGSASGTPSSSLDIPVVASNGAVAITFREGYVTFLMASVLFALGHAL
ncbi:hypothetical protein FRC01_003752, partial [Tulasnella sp. 417]